MIRNSHFSVQLTRRALTDLQSILDYSREQWGRKTADKYFSDLESGLQRLREHPELLRPEPDLHEALCFYRVNKHLLVCDVKSDSIVVLTVIHSSMDIPNRLAKLEPTLAAEVELLHGRLHKRGTKKRRRS